jgi:hypothetical protein
MPDTKTKPLARDTAEVGAFQLSSQVEYGSTRIISGFMVCPLGLGWLCASAALANGIEDVAALPFWATGTSFGEIDVRSSVTNCGSG